MSGAERATRAELRCAEPIRVELGTRILRVRFARPQRVISWAISGGGVRRASEVIWLEVDDHELRPPVDARGYVRARLQQAGAPQAVALLTSRRLHAYVDTCVENEGIGREQSLSARCIATVGLGNALRAGDLPGPSARIGTINVLCALSVPLSPEAMLEALALAAEARTLAVREAVVPSRRSGLPASGTGTDCIAIAAPALARADRYAGKHTAVGHVIGAAVESAVRRGAEQWLRERADSTREGRS
ncbi:MAG TPA: adenosylcobinamide amidohydrolase [Polyangiales bacterium]|nr:adenosylcobinamide amidohydrolase [Polyangiales bacterium]